MNARPFLLLALGLLVAAQGTRAEFAGGSEAAERERINTERAAAQALFIQRERECRDRFAVTACVDEARARQRESLGGLRRQQGLLDEAQRRQRAAERMVAIREKVSSEEARDREPRPARREAPLRIAPPRAGPARAPAPEAAASAASQARAAQETSSRIRFEARQREAQAHRDAAARRAAERAAAGKPAAAPLPVPGPR